MGRSSGKDFRRKSSRTIKPSVKANEVREGGGYVAGLPEPTPGEEDGGLCRVPTSTSTMAPSSASTIGRRSAKNRSEALVTHATARGYDLPAFTPDTLYIYFWPIARPIPGSLPHNLRAYHLKWKSATDVAEATKDIDDGADDWNSFSGNADNYGSLERFYFTIAGSFVVRAKRAFRAGKSWKEFEQAELEEDPEAGPRMKPKGRRRKMWMDEALSNDVRLAVLDVIVERVCNEIWLEEYQVADVDLVQEKRDSKVEREREGSWQPGPVGRDGEGGEAEPKEWLRDHLGLLQPIYGQETRVPDGVNDLMVSSAARQMARGTVACNRNIS